jgi:hypothetical protein
MCVTLSGASDFFPDVTLLAGDEETLLSGFGLIGDFDPNALERCYELTFLAPYRLKPTTFVFHVERLKTSYRFTEEGIPAFIALLKARGIEVEVTGVSSENLQYNVLSVADGVDTGMVIQEGFDLFAEKIEGPWVFTVEIP